MRLLTALPAANVVFPVANALRRAPARVVTSHHTPSFTYNRVLDRLDGWIGRTRAVHTVVCVSGAVQDALSGRSCPYLSKSLVIKNALSPEIGAEVVSLRRHFATIDPAPGRLIACGRLSAQKNYPVLIRAMALLPQATLDIIGTGPDEAALRSLTQDCGVAERVRFIGWRSRPDTLAAMAASDVFVQPSRFEGHSLALVEAATLGLPIIVSDVPSQVEAVVRRDSTVCALLHGADDHIALSKAVSLLSANRASRQRYAALSASLGDESNFSAMVDQYEVSINLAYRDDAKARTRHQLASQAA